MTTEAQFITTPDGTDMVLITRARYEALLAAEEDLEDAEAAMEGRASIDAEGGIPFEVETAIAAGTPPLVAWRKHRRMSQAQLAEAAGLTQAGIARLEKASPGAGRPETLDALAKALEAPRWALEFTVPDEKGPERTRALFDRANPPERPVLRAAAMSILAVDEKTADLAESALADSTVFAGGGSDTFVSKKIILLVPRTKDRQGKISLH